MSSETTVAAEQCRLQEWAAQIRECQRRPAGMSIVSWCACHGITKANYYYRLRRVREACLESICGENLPQQIVRVRPEILRVDEKKQQGCAEGTGHLHKGIFHPCNRILIHVSSGRGT